MSVILASVIVAFVLVMMMWRPALSHRHRRKPRPLLGFSNGQGAINGVASSEPHADSSFLLACAEIATEDWRPDGGDGSQFVWSVAAVTTHGELLYHRVSACNHREAVSAARREISDVARIVGASPVSL